MVEQVLVDYVPIKMLTDSGLNVNLTDGHTFKHRQNMFAQLTQTNETDTKRVWRCL